MSRVGRKIIPIPSGVAVQIDGTAVQVKGPRGQLESTFHSEMKIVLEDGTLHVERPDDVRFHRALHGLTRSLLANMVTGVTTGFRKDMELVGVGYRAQKQGEKLVLSVGYSHPVEIVPPAGITFEVENPNRFSIQGIDKQLVGQVAADVRAWREPEPYKGKGIKYAGEIILRKAGKSGKVGGKKR